MGSIDTDGSYFFENYVFVEILANFKCAGVHFPVRFFKKTDELNGYGKSHPYFRHTDAL